MRYKVTVHEVTNWEEGNESQADYSHGWGCRRLCGPC